MVKIVAGLLLVLATPSVAGVRWQICMDDSASLLTTPVRAAVLREFQSLMGGQVARIEFQRCASDVPRMRLAIKREPPEGLEEVLGLAYRRRGRIEPRLEVFHGALIRYLGEPNNANAIGRALARVAAHEAKHFLEQQGDHCELGLMRAVLPAYELAARNRWPFRRTSRCRTDKASIAQHGSISEPRAPVRQQLRDQRLASESEESPIR